MKRLSLILLVLCGLILPHANAKLKRKSMIQNPFAEKYETPYNIPPFQKIKLEHYTPALEEGMKAHNKEIAQIVSNSAQPNFENTVLALDTSGELYNRVCYVFFALSQSDATPEMQKLADKLTPMIIAHNDELYMNVPLFERIKAVHDNADKLGLTLPQRRLTEKYYKRFVRNGALLSPALQDTLKAMNKQLASLQLAYGNNVMNEIANTYIEVTNADELKGLPQTTIDAAAATASKLGKQGWVFTPSASMRLAVLNSADNRELRRKMYQAYTTVASRGNEYDNSANINQILQLRQRKAKMLGFATFADYAIDPVMAKTVDAAEGLLMQLFKPATEKVKEEVADMQAYVNRSGEKFEIEPWDYYYYAGKVKAEKYNFDEEDLRPYFEFNNVLRNGVFYAAEKLFGVTFTEIKKAPKYHPEVTVYDVKDKATGKHIAVFMTDYFPRDSKQQGAWMSEFQGEFNYDGKLQRPIVYNVGSFTPPTKSQPSLLTLDEVETMFHEFGHALQGMLTTAAYPGIAGTNVDRDIVEMPSQLNEHWAWEPEVLKNYARHYKTGEVMPQELVDKLLASNKFNQGFMMTELVGAALMDINWHKVDWAKDINVKEFENYVKRNIGMPKQIEFRYRSPYFKHIFADDQYASGYYTYLWSQVLEADAFETFKKEGTMNPDVAKRYRECILEPGDSDDAMTLYMRFTGHKPQVEPLLRNRGLIK